MTNKRSPPDVGLPRDWARPLARLPQREHDDQAFDRPKVAESLSDRSTGNLPIEMPTGPNFSEFVSTSVGAALERGTTR